MACSSLTRRMIVKILSQMRTVRATARRQKSVAVHQRAPDREHLLLAARKLPGRWLSRPEPRKYP